MKIKTLVLSAFMSVCALANYADAATIDLGTLSVGQSGSSVSPISGISAFYDNVITGLLPADSKITLSYSLPGFNGILSDQGNYSYDTSTTHNEGTTFSSSVGINASTGNTNPLGSSTVTTTDSLVLSTANITGTSGTATITNLSSSVANFASLLLGFLSAGNQVIVSYNVSTVPLPASAVMFGLALLALAGVKFGTRKQNQTAAYAA